MRVLVLSDPHFAGDAEKARRGWERRAIRLPALRSLATLYRRFLWLADPTAHNARLDDFLRGSGSAGWIVANGDYSCDSAFVGVADDAAYASAEECLAKLRCAFGARLLATLGDHELGKMSLFGGVGGPRLASWRRCLEGLGLEPVWTRDLGAWVLAGITSTLWALEVFEPELEPEERTEWRRLREEHREAVRDALGRVRTDQRIVLFCHDPTALPFLAKAPWFESFLPRVALTVIGHLHSELVLRTSRVLAGMPEFGWLGNTARRLSGALRRARGWRQFNVVLCPSLAGVQVMKDGGYLAIDLEPDGRVRVDRRRLPWTT